jgi:hypothetical protein
MDARQIRGVLTLNQPENNLPEGHIKVDRRYRQSNYFLNDQLRYAESIQDFRSVKQAVIRSSHFNLSRAAFQFAKVPVTDDKT